MRLISWAWLVVVAIGVSVGSLASPSAARAQTVLIFDDGTTHMRAIDAATRLGLTFTRARAADFETLLRGATWDLVIVDLPSTEPAGAWQDAIVSHIRAGGRAIHTHWNMGSLAGLPAAYEVTTVMPHDTIPFYRWSMDPLFSTPQMVPTTIMTMDIWGTNGFYLQPIGTARAAAGFSMMPAMNQAAIVIGNSGRTIFNGFMFDDYGTFDTDADGIPDITELVMNEISLLATVFPTAPCMGRPEGSMCTATPGGAGLCRGGVCCFGCWTGTRCERGMTGTACGAGGAMCASCSDGMPCTLDTCTAGTCSNPMAPVGSTCDDGMYCTVTDTCNAAGGCGGTGMPCSDGDGCTMDVCDEAMDRCTFPPVAGSCTIGGVCVGEGMTNPAYPCQICDPARNPMDWSPRALGESCGMNRCTMGRLRTFSCNATGGCVMSVPTDCPTGMCFDTTSCAPGCMPGECAAGEFCDASTMRCLPLVPDGMACTDPSACTSGMCVDGVCCTTACDGTCERCDATGAMGACQSLPLGTDPDEECPMTCDGAGACTGGVDAGSTDSGTPGDAGTPGSDGAVMRTDGGRRRTSEDSGGCGCRTASGTDATWLPVVIAVAAVAGAFRRRRRKG